MVLCSYGWHKNNSTQDTNPETIRLRFPRIAIHSLGLSRGFFFTGDMMAGEGYIYIVRAGQFYKIGMSANPKKRIEAINQGLPLDLEVIGTWPALSARDVEVELHEQCKGRHAKGEWYRLTGQGVADLVAALQTIVHNKQMLTPTNLRSYLKRFARREQFKEEMKYEEVLV